MITMSVLVMYTGPPPDLYLAPSGARQVTDTPDRPGILLPTPITDSVALIESEMNSDYSTIQEAAILNVQLLRFPTVGRAELRDHAVILDD